MNEESTFWVPQATARELDISTATLRRWSDEFSGYLSSEANSEQGRSHRRYTNSDLEILSDVKELMSNGFTYEQARQQLDGRLDDEPGPVTRISPEIDVDDLPPGGFRQPLDDIDDDIEDNEEKALVAANGSESPAVAFLNNTLATLSDTQKSILNSQSANRELLGVLIQDNFNLKEENNRLRERIREVERSMVHQRQEEEWRREAMRQELEAKVTMVQQMAQQAITTAQSIEVEVPEIKTTKSNPGCLGAMLGLTNTEVTVVPRRHKGRSAQAAGPVGGTPQYPASPAASSRPVHPRPTAPPE